MCETVFPLPGHVQLAQWLVAQGASLTTTNNFGCHAMHWAAEGDAVTVGQWLMTTTVSPNSTSPCYWHTCNANGHSPLHMAARKGHANIARWLLRVDGGGVSVDMLNKTDNDGYSPAAIARLEGRVELANWMDSQICES